jgi:hypothetical protein
MQRLVLFGLLAAFGGLVVVGFALYGAYRKFGVRGLVIVAIIVSFGIIALGRFLLSF